MTDETINKRAYWVMFFIFFEKMILWPRRSWKTTKLIKKSADTWICIVVFSESEAKRVQYESYILWLKIPKPLTVKEYRERAWFWKREMKVFFDNFDSILWEEVKKFVRSFINERLEIVDATWFRDKIVIDLNEFVSKELTTKE